MIVDYSFKSLVLSSDIPGLQRQLSKYLYYYDCYLKDSNFNLVLKGVPISFEHLKVLIDGVVNELSSLLGDNWQYNKYYIESKKINHSSYYRVKRLNERIKAMISNPCIFLTLTFTNEYISLKGETLRKYVQRYLNSLNCPYVANIDFGKKNGRLHYHALVQIDRVNYKDWIYGDLDFKKVYNDNSKAISKYISKLTNHAIKETTKGCKIMYSRSV